MIGVGRVPLNLQGLACTLYMRRLLRVGTVGTNKDALPGISPIFGVRWVKWNPSYMYSGTYDRVVAISILFPAPHLE